MRFGNEFKPEFFALHEDVRTEILALARLLQQFGRQLGRPHVDTLSACRHANMEELRLSAADGGWRVASAEDKSGGSEKRFYRELIRFDAHLARLEKEDNHAHQRG